MKSVLIGNQKFYLPFADLVPISDDDRLAIQESICESGMLEPVVIWQEKSDDDEVWVIDGVNRCLAAEALGHAEVPTRAVSAADHAVAEKMCLDLNEARRQLTPEAVSNRRRARRERVAAAREEGQSLRTIAENEEVSVQTVIQDIESTSTVRGGTVEPTGGQVMSKDGKKRPAKMPKADKPVQLYPPIQLPDINTLTAVLRSLVEAHDAGSDIGGHIDKARAILGIPAKPKAVQAPKPQPAGKGYSQEKCRALGGSCCRKGCTGVKCPCPCHQEGNPRKTFPAPVV